MHMSSALYCSHCHTHTGEGGLTMVLTAGVYRGVVKRLSNSAYSSSVDGNAKEGSLQRLPPRLGGGATPESQRGDRARRELSS